MHLFRGLVPEALDRIAAIASQEAYAVGHYVFREGEVGDKLYLVLDGKIRISRQLSGMGEEALAILGVGEAFGEMSLIDDTPRSADARVHENAKLLVITREAFEDLLFIHKDLAFEILWNFIKTLSGRLREANDKMAFMTMTGRF
jgi:CRP-like cAMP-binding protein